MWGSWPFHPNVRMSVSVTGNWNWISLMNGEMFKWMYYSYWRLILRRNGPTQPLKAYIPRIEGAEKSCMGMSCLNMAVGQLPIGELHPTALCKAIIVLGRDAPFCLLKVFVLGMKSQGDVLILNEVSEMPLVALRNRELSGEQSGHWDQVPACYPQWGVPAHVLKIRG